MFRKLVVSFFLACASFFFPLNAYGDHSCDCDILDDPDSCEICDPCGVYSFTNPYLVVPWSYYNYFYLDDGRPDGAGTANGQSVLLGFDYYFFPCLSLGFYGIYENTKNKSPIVGAVGEILGRRTLSRTEGWGGGVHVNYVTPCGPVLFFDYSYVSIGQGRTTQDLSGLLTDIVNHSSGHRWQISTGLYTIVKYDHFTLNANANYLYIYNRMGGTIDSLNQELTGQNSTLGIGNATATLYFFPDSSVQPFISGAIAYDLNRHVDFPIFTTISGSAVATFPFRERFEWMAGTGVLLTKGRFSFSAAYRHKRRPGPIKTDILTLYVATSF